MLPDIWRRHNNPEGFISKIKLLVNYEVILFVIKSSILY